MQESEQHDTNTEKGAAMLLIVLFVVFISVGVIVGMTTPVIKEFRTMQSVVKGTNAYYHAESGIEDVFYRLKNMLPTGGVHSYTYDHGTTTVSVASTGSDTYTLTSLGNVDSHLRTIESIVSNNVTNVHFDHAVQVNSGGITMQNGSQIHGITGPISVYTSGPVTGQIGELIDGDVIVSTNMIEATDERSVLCNADIDVGRLNMEADAAQSFVATTTMDLSKVSLFIKKVGNPGSVDVHIVADVVGSPDTVPLGSGVLDTSLVGVNYAWVDVAFTAPISLVSGQTYWVVLNGVKNASKYWVWCVDSTDTYLSGSAVHGQDWTGGAWVAITGDFAFKTFYGDGMSVIDDIDLTGVAKAHTIIDSAVGGDAYYQTLISSSVGGVSYSGSAIPPTITTPINQDQITKWKAEALSGGVVSGDCPGTPGCATHMGPVKIVGDMHVPINETLILTGIVHVTGNFEADNNTLVRCDPLYGERSCLLIVDGYIGIYNNTLFSGSGDTKSFIIMMSTVDNCHGGIQTPACAAHNSAINIVNNATGAIFYATDSLVYINNNVAVTSVFGHGLYLENNAEVHYDANVTDINISNGPQGGWSVWSWFEIE